MADRPDKALPTLEALVKNTEALTHLNATLTGFQQDYADGKRISREAHLAVTAKLDNLDRSVSELRLALENGEAARQAELERIFKILGEERKDRKQVTETAGKDEKELIRQMVRTEFDDRRKERSLLVEGLRAIWHVGGKYIVLAVAVLLVAAVMKMTGMSLADILGLAGK